MKFYRVFPHDSSAALREKGGALFVPRSSAGRADNPVLYGALYVSDCAEGAVAETFGRLPIWRPVDFVHAGGHRMMLATHEFPNDLQLCDMDDIRVLEKFGIRHPSRVVTRDRKLTQSWAREIYETHEYAGVQWWSYYNPDWRGNAIWDLDTVVVDSHYDSLDEHHEIVKNAASILVRQIDVR